MGENYKLEFRYLLFLLMKEHIPPVIEILIG